jgi:hypothetical protein
VKQKRGKWRPDELLPKGALIDGAVVDRTVRGWETDLNRTSNHQFSRKRIALPLIEARIPLGGVPHAENRMDQALADAKPIETATLHLSP